MDNTYAYRKVSIICPDMTDANSPIISLKEILGDKISKAKQNSWLLNEINDNGENFKVFMRALDMRFSLITRRYINQGILLGVCHMHSKNVFDNHPDKTYFSFNTLINGLLNLFVSYQVITKSEYTSYLEFGIEDLGVMSCSEHLKLTNMDVLQGIYDSL